MKLEDVFAVVAHKTDYQLDVAEFAMNIALASDINLVSCCCCCCCI